MSRKLQVIPREEIGYLTVIKEVKTDGEGTYVLCVCICKPHCHVVKNLSKIRKQEARGRSRPSCGCTRRRKLTLGKQYLKKSLFKGIYSLEYEKSRYDSPTISRRDARRKVRRILLRRKWKEMLYTHSSNRQRRKDRQVSEVCPEWSDPDTGFESYFNHFYPLMPRTISKKFTIRRINPKKGFYPSNCSVVYKQRGIRQDKSLTAPLLPSGITAAETQVGTKYRIRCGATYLGTTDNLDHAKEILLTHTKSLGKSPTLVALERRYRKHPKYKVWFRLKSHSVRKLRPDAVRILPSWDHSLGIRGFLNFLKDTKKEAGDKHSLVKKDPTLGYIPTNIIWTK